MIRPAGARGEWVRRRLRSARSTKLAVNPVLVPGLPANNGLRFRSFIGGEDAEARYAVLAGRVARDDVDPWSSSEDFPSRDELRATLSQAASAGLQNQWLVARIKDRIVGSSRTAGWPEMDGMRVYLILGWVPPEWRGKGIGTALFHGCGQTAEAPSGGRLILFRRQHITFIEKRV